MSLRLHRSLGPALLWAGLCAWLLLTPGRGLPPVPAWTDKAAHFVLFLVQGWLLFWGLRSAGRSRPAVAAAATAVLYASVLEVGQLWVPGRSWEWADLLAGAAGGLVVVVVARQRRQPSL